MHRLLIAIASVAFTVAALTVTAAAGVPCVGKACASLKIAADGCTFSNTGTESIVVSLTPDQPWQQAHAKEDVALDFVIAAGKEHAMPEGACVPAKNLNFHMASFGTAVAMPKKVDAQSTFLESKKLCTGNACQQITLKAFDSCLWLESAASQKVTTELKLTSGATIRLVLEAGDLEQTKSEDPLTTAARNQEVNTCETVLRSKQGLDEMRARGSQIPTTEVDTKASACKALLAAATAKPDAPRTAYHHAIFEPIAGREMAVYRAKVMNGETCVARADLTSFTAIRNAAP